MSTNIRLFFRFLKRNSFYAFVNIMGLAASLTVIILITSYVHFELNVDKHHENYDRICRVETDYLGKGTMLGTTFGAVGPILVDEVPEIIDFARIYILGRNTELAYEDQKFVQEKIWGVDQRFIQMFHYPLEKGNRENALDEPFSIVLTKEMAEKYFPGINPIGKTMLINNQLPFTVTGVLEPYAKNTQFHFNALISGNSINSIVGEGMFDEFRLINLFTYVLLEKNYNLDAVKQKTSDFLQRHVDEKYPTKMVLHPLEDIYFNPLDRAEFKPVGDKKQISILIAIAIILLVITIINFTNLTTAQSLRRAKEIGIKKVTGGTAPKLISQFLTESFLQTLLAGILAVLLATFFLPHIGNLFNREFSISSDLIIFLSLFISGIILLVSILSGLYPAFYLASLSPVSILYKKNLQTGGVKILRLFLLFLQITISVTLIISSVIVLKQTHYLKNKELGYNKEQTFYIQHKLEQDHEQETLITFKKQVLNFPEVSGVAISESTPIHNFYAMSVSWEGVPEDEKVRIQLNNVDRDFLSTFQIPLMEGSIFPDNFEDTTNYLCLINEQLFKETGWKSAVGKKMDRYRVVGVFKDYQIGSTKEEIPPTIFIPLVGKKEYYYNQSVCISFRVTTKDWASSLDKIQNVFLSYFPDRIFNPIFIDQRFNDLFKEENSFAQSISYLTLLAIIIASLGLYAFVSYLSVQNLKMYGIRKVHGASIGSLFILESKKFFYILIAANFIAGFSGYFLMKKWLTNFAHKITINADIFLLTFAVSFLIIALSISYVIIKSARRNPAEILSHE